MKRVRAKLLVGALILLGPSAAWAADRGQSEPTSDIAAEKASREPSAEVAAKKPSREVIVDVANETASHEEIEPLRVKFGRLSALRLDHCGRLLACDAEAEEIKVINRSGRQIGVIKPGFAPEAIDVAPDGTIYCGGRGQLAMLDRCGRVLCTAAVPEDAASRLGAKRRAMSRPLAISGIAVTDKDVFVAFGSGWSLGSKSKLFRFDRRLASPKLLAEGLRGCCQRCDIVARNGVVYLAENSAHRVVLYNREGEVLDKWGERSRTDIEGFGACCNPMNLCFGSGGALYSSESGLGRVKRYTTDGKYLGLVGYVGVERFTSAGRTAASCSNMAIAVTRDGSRVYVMDCKDNLIRVLQKKKAEGEFPIVRRRCGIRIFGGCTRGAGRFWRPRRFCGRR